MMRNGEIHVPEKTLVTFIAAIFKQAGGTNTEALAIAKNLVETNLQGHDSHGVVRVPRYIEYVRDGHVFFDKSAKEIIRSDSYALLDGEYGFGQTLGHQAVDIGLEMVNQQGIALVALRKSGHLGRIGAWAEKAAAAGIAAIHFVNAARSDLVAPFGGAERRMSTAPVCIGIPEPDGDFILDFATSEVAEGKVLVAQNGGKPVPVGSLVDADGQPTSDPVALYGKVGEGEIPDAKKGAGALAAMGGHKGSGLAIACELLAGALTGSGLPYPGLGIHNGMLSIYFDPHRLDDAGNIGEAVSDYLHWIKSCKPADPEQPVLLPGEKERLTRADRLRFGIPLAQTTWNGIVAVAKGLGIDEVPL